MALQQTVEPVAIAAMAVPSPLDLPQKTLPRMTPEVAALLADPIMTQSKPEVAPMPAGP